MAIDYPEGLYPIYMGIYDVVDDPSSDSIISWSKSHTSFIIWNPIEFEKKILPRKGRISCPTFKIFVRMAKKYGFKRHHGSEHSWEFGHKNGYFVRGRPDLLKIMQAKFFNQRTRLYLAKQATENKLAPALDALRV